MPHCCVCREERPKAGQTYNGKPLCRECIDYMQGKHRFSGKESPDGIAGAGDRLDRNCI